MINCWIPWRYYISQCFQNHEFPFWNPYQQLGYPIHADLQGPTWYLESILVSMTSGQTNYTLHFLFIFYVFMAGMGMYFLCLGFHTNRAAAFITGVCYMLGGFFVAHVQHFYAIIGAAWLPYILLNYYKMYTTKNYWFAVYAAIFMFFNLTGGNHTFSIILAYLFITIFIFFIYKAVRDKQKEDALRFIKLNLLFGGLTILLAFVVLAAFYQTAPYISRLSGMSYKDAAVCPLSPQSLLSLLSPFSTVNSIDFYNTDQSMCNIYTGCIMLVFILLACISKKQPIEKILFGFAIVCLIASFGAYTPLHKFLFNYFPFINRFRFPSYFSLFSVIIFLILGSKQLALMAFEAGIGFKKYIRTAIVTLSVLLLIIVFALVKNQGQPFFFTHNFNTIFEFLQASSFYQNIVLQGILQVLILGAFIITLTTSLKKYWLSIASCLVVIDLIIAVQLNIAYVGISPASPKELHDYIATLPQDFPTPSNDNIIDNTEEIGQKHGLYRNTSIFHKRISADVFNSYSFKNYSLLSDSLPVLFKAMLHNPMAYLSNEIYPASKVSMLDSSSITNKTIVLQDQDYALLREKVEKTTHNSLIENTSIVDFSPNKIRLKVHSGKQQLLTLLQSHYTGWQATIDQNPSTIYLSNYLTMTVVVPKGEHEIVFSYSNPLIVIAAIISYTTFLILLILLSYQWIKNRRNYWASYIILPTLILITIYYFAQM